MVPSTALAQLGTASPRSCTVAVKVSIGCTVVVAATVGPGAHTAVAASARTPKGTHACRATVPAVVRRLQRDVVSDLLLLILPIPSRRHLGLKQLVNRTRTPYKHEGTPERVGSHSGKRETGPPWPPGATYPWTRQRHSPGC